METHISVLDRFGWFFGGHMVVSVLSLMALLCAFAVGDGVFWSAWPLLAAMLALYVPAGWLLAWEQGWPRPTPKEGALAVLLPALVAWMWALTGWGLMTLAHSDIGLWLLISTGAFATPSFYLMLLTILSAANDPLWGPAWYLAMFLAGLLPPLLFFLGSILPKKRLTTAENVIN